MALLKEFTTWPQHQQLFYKVTGSAINFEVKALWNAEVALSANPHGLNDYTITLKSDSCSIINKLGADVSQRIRNLLSRDEFKEFWISWRNNVIAVGRGSRELLRLEGVTKHLKYIAFYVKNDRNWAEWKCYLPAVINNLPLKHLSGGEPRWVSPEDQLPDDAVRGGFENEDLYIMRAEHRGALTPGKFIPSEGVGMLAWGGESHEGVDIQILCGYNCAWVLCRDGRVPAGAVAGGRSEDGEALYVGRAGRGGHLVPGKVQPSHRCCYIPHGEREIAVKKYQVLVVPSTDDRPVFASLSDSDSDSDSFFDV